MCRHKRHAMSITKILFKFIDAITSVKDSTYQKAAVAILRSHTLHSFLLGTLPFITMWFQCIHRKNRIDFPTSKAGQIKLSTWSQKLVSWWKFEYLFKNRYRKKRKEYKLSFSNNISYKDIKGKSWCLSLPPQGQGLKGIKLTRGKQSKAGEENRRKDHGNSCIVWSCWRSSWWTSKLNKPISL